MYRKGRERAEKRQKLYSHVKKKSSTRQKTAETLQSCKETVACAPKNGRNFTSAPKTKGRSLDIQTPALKEIT
ncbi:hypothetical protein CJI50_04660 [Bifidobacteriaceae bacterium NR021]|nr:hypothetical protein CJI50_04660 [Bifidobacteriaceae bacterium NR021]